VNTWVKAALVTVVSAVGALFVAGSLFGDGEPLPDVGAPVVMEVATDGQGAGADEGGGTDAPGGIVHPEPVPGASDRREAALERRADRREPREQRRADRPDPRPVGDDDGDDDGGGDGGGDDDGDDGDGDGGDDDGDDDD
jgi:hypothetical protein